MWMRGSPRRITSWTARRRSGVKARTELSFQGLRFARTNYRPRHVACTAYHRSMSSHEKTLSLNVTSLDLVVVPVASRGCGGGTKCDPWSCWPTRSYDPSFGMEVRCSGRHGWLDAAYNLVSLVCFSFFLAGGPWRLLGEGGLGGSSPFSRSRGL